MRKTPCLMAALIVWPTLGWGVVTDLHVLHRPGTLSDGTEVIANVLSIDFEGTYSGGQLLINLNSGSIYNDSSVGGDLAPNPVFLHFFPDLVFDTYIANGGLTSDQDQGQYALGGGAVNVDASESTAVFNEGTKISQGFGPRGGNIIPEGTGFVIAQLTLSPDANGTFAARAYAENSGVTFSGFYVENGRILPLSGILPGDYDSSDQVGQGDLDFILQNWGRNTTTDGVPTGWVSGELTGPVSQNELDAVLTNWGSTNAPDLTGFSGDSSGGSSGGSVPEPASAALLGASLLTLRRRAA